MPSPCKTGVKGLGVKMLVVAIVQALEDAPAATTTNHELGSSRQFQLMSFLRVVSRPPLGFVLSLIIPFGLVFSTRFFDRLRGFLEKTHEK